MRFTLVILGILFAMKAAAQTLSTSMDATSDEALIQAAEKMIQEPEKKVEAAEKAVDRTPTQVPEDQILIAMKPVSETTVQTPADTTWRMVASLAFVIVVGGGLFYASRRWRRVPDKGGQTARIEMMHQFHVGPRRSIALIRVAGETMLVGITDQNINMLKSISLIDDEMEDVMGKKPDFNGFLEDEFSIEDVRTALRS